MMPSIQVPHITINTGHSCNIRGSARQSRAAAAMFGALLASMLEQNGRSVPIPFYESYAIAAREDGDTLIAEVSRLGIPLFTFIATAGNDSVAAAQHWAKLVQTATLPCRAGSAPRMPRGPWVAVSLRLEYLMFDGISEWAGDLEASIGWTWLERMRTRPRATT